MNLLVCPREERSDVAVHLSTAFVDRRSRRASFAMTNMSSLTGAQRRGHPSGLPSFLLRDSALSAFQLPFLGLAANSSAV